MKKKVHKKSKRKKPTPRGKLISARAIQDLRKLAEQAGEIIPATAFGNGAFCFKKIAFEYHLGKYWPKARKNLSKKEAIYSFLNEVYRRHRKVFYKIFRENLARGIERRRNSGKPVLEAEILELNATLKSLEVDLEREILALKLPKDRPTIVPPPQEFKSIIDKIGLHPFLLPECVNLFKNGHLNEAARKALEKYEVYVQKKSSLQLIGTDLMGTAFSEKRSYVRITDTSHKRGAALQDGFKLLSMGVMGFWRNYLSHGDEKQIPHQDAVAILGVISHMMNVIDSAPSESAVDVALATTVVALPLAPRN
ncbi:TIGR02391 family protein [Candidatus Kaiserbacteria bacterium RIFCSPLOWO2_01_FULL_53_17]|uniref:TIGR02391 family protein n=1 Tax=Candidatus Kaiserbacteria bacterium RIFCSPLOWO2_01_FULL_53_17 TaxID=1798511 RepID=A0A1F6EGS0_9BACT|nr:MAG: TIGR02391 family protein [Candidatus Kaiserbacteria bacterium RIFCSPLOWO2_01_FULL_53_17]